MGSRGQSPRKQSALLLPPFEPRRGFNIRPFQGRKPLRSSHVPWVSPTATQVVPVRGTRHIAGNHGTRGRGTRPIITNRRSQIASTNPLTTEASCVSLILFWAGKDFSPWNGVSSWTAGRGEVARELQTVRASALGVMKDGWRGLRGATVFLGLARGLICIKIRS